jgi:CheY-like chemotaxis protein
MLYTTSRDCGQLLLERRMRILVVDDVGYVRHYFDRLLTQNGHLVWTAASGFQALEILKQEALIQVVITDLLMPGMDGIELFTTAKKLERRDETGSLALPVFYLITALRPSSASQHRETNLLQKAMQMGFAEVLLKPIDNEHLLQQLANLEQKLLRNQPGRNDAAQTDHAELLHVIDQNIERLLCCENQSALTELAELLRGSLARIPKITSPVDTLPSERSADVEQTLPGLDSQNEPVFSTGRGFSPENGLSTESQT